MFSPKQEDIMKSACGEFGRGQIIIAIEEMSELTKELTKAYRGLWNKKNTAEEIADVYIMLYQMQYFLDVDDKTIQPIIDMKLKRLEQLLENPFDSDIDSFDIPCRD